VWGKMMKMMNLGEEENSRKSAKFNVDLRSKRDSKGINRWVL
jgi:hypothetical protein